MISNRKVKNTRRFYYTLFACIILMIYIISMTINSPPRELALKRSSHCVKVKYVNAKNVPDAVIYYSFATLPTQEQLINESSTIFRGTVQDIKNIEISHGGDSIDYKAIATIKVIETYKGDTIPGELVQMLVPCPMNGTWVKNSFAEALSVMQVGTEGIFMPIKYDDTSIFNYSDGVVLYYEEICEYGLQNGALDVFVETEQGRIVYFERAFDIYRVPITLDTIGEHISVILDKAEKSVKTE